MSQCYNPFFVQNPSPSRGKEKIPVPCGKCPVCLQRRASSWAIRLEEHQKTNGRAHFLTLTYSQPPITKNGYMTLVKRDWQLFIKRLRRAHPKNTEIRYYACGEYGSIRWRPHYHAIIFGIDADLIIRAWREKDVDEQYDKKTLQLPGIPGIWEADPDVNEANTMYVTKYMTKGKRIPLHSKDDRLPEFSLMSKNLGKSFLTPEMIKYYQSNPENMYVTREGGVKVAMPRYYRDRIFSEEQRAAHAKKVSMLSPQWLQKAKDEFYKKYPNDHFERSFSETIKQLEKILFENAARDRDDL